MPTQTELIGEHPLPPTIFGKFFDAEDVEVTTQLCHRILKIKSMPPDDEFVDWLAKRLVFHHYDPSTIARLKKKYEDIGFPQYAAKHRQLPTLDVTKKGNATEILLIEYLEGCHGKPMIKTYKLRFNPNVDQAVKGDDILLVNVVDERGENEALRVFLGEAKFRSAPDQDVLADLSSSLAKDKMPISFGYLINELYKSNETLAQAELLDQFVIEEIKKKGNIKFAGMLLSNHRTSNYVTNNFKSDNPSMVIVSAGIRNPSDLINAAFLKAEDLLANPKDL